ncbi:MAG TPA: beta-propeller fold lactonase family protein [Sinorhizobium sp.]|nr:beta-propeller fold lactonase family protein [Sinorhizobium sp.]
MSGMKAAILASLTVLICLWVLPVAAAELVYIPLGSANRIIVVAPEGDRIVDQIEGLPAVHGLAGTPDGRFLIAGSYDEREPSENAPAKPTGMSEDEHAAHHARPAENAPGPDSAISTVSVISIAQRAVVRRIDVPGAVHHVAISPNGSVAVVTQPNQDTISVIDLKSYQVLVTVPTGPLPNFAVFSPEGQQVYVSNAGNDTVSTLDTASWQVLGDIAVGVSPEHLVLSRDGTILYVNNVGDGTVSVLDLRAGKVVQTIPIGDTLHGIDLSEDGRTLFVSALGEDKLAAVNLLSGDHRSTTLGPEPYHLTVVRGTGKLYVSSAEAPKLWVVDQQTLAVGGEISVGGKAHQMVQVTSE